MKTAIQWLVEQVNSDCLNSVFIKIELIEQAKEMEKQQVSKAFFEGRLKEIGSGVLFDLQPLSETFDNYYNETFEK